MTMVSRSGALDHRHVHFLAGVVAVAVHHRVDHGLPHRHSELMQFFLFESNPSASLRIAFSATSTLSRVESSSMRRSATVSLRSRRVDKLNDYNKILPGQMSRTGVLPARPVRPISWQPAPSGSTILPQRVLAEGALMARTRMATLNLTGIKNGYVIADASVRGVHKFHMNNVQIALRDPNYARELGNLLSSDGAHRVYVVDQPLPAIDGVVVLDEQGVAKIPASNPDRERYVVLTNDRGPARLANLWNAGIRHVIFSGDALTIAQLAILAAEMQTQLRHCN